MKLALPVIVIACSLSMSSATAQEAAGSAPWRAEAQDNICGVSNPRQVTNPAVVDYAKVLKATPEMQDLVARGIDPQSAEGQILRQRAVDHVGRVSSKVMRRNGHCSIWKTIKHRSGRNAPELTHELVASISVSAVAMGSGGQGFGEVYAADSAERPGSRLSFAWLAPALIGFASIGGGVLLRKSSSSGAS